MERKLATIRKIKEIQPIKDADNIELALVDGWKSIVKKGEFKIDELIIYCEIDSFLPIKPEFEFLRKSSYKKMGDQEGFRLKTIKLRGQISQGLILPLKVLPKKKEIFGEGFEVTNDLNIVKYEPPIPAQLAGLVKGIFPSFIPKTDEERVQNLDYEILKDEVYYETEKLDGTSFTCYKYEGEFGVCSRNMELKETEDNLYWKISRQHNLEEKLPEGYAIQGEIIGEGVQGNPYKLKGQHLKIFNIFNIQTQEYLHLLSFEKFVNDILKEETVPMLRSIFFLPEEKEDLIQHADYKSIINPDIDREGIVIRSLDRKTSFKVISNKYLINHEH